MDTEEIEVQESCRRMLFIGKDDRSRTGRGRVLVWEKEERN